MQNRLISICIPTYNQVVYLERTLESIFIQKNVDFEVIITDDSSSNQVFDLVQKFLFNGKKIHYFKNNEQLGAPQNWNYSISKAKGEYIKIMHHDEWFNSDSSLSQLLQKVEVNSKCIVFSASVSVYKGQTSYFNSSDELIALFNKEPERIILGNYIGSPSAILFHKDIKIEFDVKLKWLVDIDFYVRMIKSGAYFTYIDEYLYTSMIDDHNITNKCLYDTELNLYEYSYVFKKHIRSKSILIQIFYLDRIFKILRLHNKKRYFTLFLRLIKKAYYVQ